MAGLLFASPARGESRRTQSVFRRFYPSDPHAYSRPKREHSSKTRNECKECRHIAEYLSFFRRKTDILTDPYENPEFMSFNRRCS
jgi:hypothetical protein